MALWCRFVAALIALMPGSVLAQANIAERYDRAAKLMVMPAMASVKNESIVPRWIGDQDRFWYRRETAKGSEFVVVDARTGAVEPAFDAARIAAALSPVLKMKVAPDNLPFSVFNYSPDGKAITFNAGSAKYKCSLADGVCEAQPVTVEPHMIASPDGRKAVFSKGGNLFVRNLATGADRQLTSNGAGDKGWGIAPEPSDFRALARQTSGAQRTPFQTVWSPDGRLLITTFTDHSFVEPYPFVDYAPADGSFRPKARSIRLALVGEKPAFTQFHVIDVASGASKKVELDSERILLLEIFPWIAGWSADGRHYRRFAEWANGKGASLFEINAQTGKVREVIKENGRHPALISAGGYGAPNVAFVQGGKQAIWSSQRDGWAHLYLYDIASGRQLRQLTKGKWVVRELLRADDKLQRIYFVANGRETGNPYFRSVYSVAYDGRGLRRLTPEMADKPIASPRSDFPAFDGAKPYDPVSPTGDYIVYSYSGVAQPAVLTLRRTDGQGEAKILERADASALFARGYKVPTEFTAKAADGKSDLYGVIYRPSDYDPSRRYPVLLAQYDSPIVVVTPRNFGSGYSLTTDASGPAAQTELGIIVVVVDPRGTPFRGAAFSDPPSNFIADMGLTDQKAVIRQLAAKDPSMDITRVGIAGASFGGWTAIRAMIDHNDLFTAAIAWAGPGSFHNMYVADGLSNSLGQPIYDGGKTLRPGVTAIPDNWKIADSIGQVGKLKGRLLVGTGGLDENVVPGSQLQFFEAAARANKDVEQMFLPSATHGPGPGLWPYMVKRTWDFLTRTLLLEQPPTDYYFPKGAFPPAPGR